MKPNGDDDDKRTASEGEPAECGTLLNTLPASTSVGVGLDAEIEFTLDATDGTEVIVMKSEGVPVGGTSSIQGERVIFALDEGDTLWPVTDYEVTLDWCGGPTTSTWSTGSVATYALDLRSGYFAEPAGIGPLLQQQMETLVLIGVVGQPDTDLETLGALSLPNSAVQDSCEPTLEIPVADFSNGPDFEIGPTRFGMTIEGVEFHFEDTSLSGTFAGTRIDNAELSRLIDSRRLDELVGATGDPGAICDLVMAFGVMCIPCPDGQNFCLDTLIQNIEANLVPGLVLQPVTQQQADLNCP